jgi:hypothetical protein
MFVLTCVAREMRSKRTLYWRSAAARDGDRLGDADGT